MNTQSEPFPKLAASACVWKEDKVLLIQRAKAPIGLWSLPGGHVEFGETALAAARRELLEETGVTAELTEFVGLYEIISSMPPLHYAIACYCGLWLWGDATAAGDAFSAQWVSANDLHRLDFVPNVAEAIARARILLKL